MKLVFSLFSMMLLLVTSANAQGGGGKPQASPKDSVTAVVETNVNVKVVYSRPSLKGRAIGTEIVPFGKLWRTGANAATTFEVDTDVTINGQKLSAGIYSIYTIPNKEKTTVIFNKTWKQWGTQYDESQDALRIEVKSEWNDELVEQFTIEIEEDGDVEFKWGTFEFEFTVKKA